MQKIFFLIVTVLVTVSAEAQSIKLPVGKKFGITVISEFGTTASAMGQEMEIKNSFSSVIDSEIKKITDKGFTYTGILKKTRISIGVMGQEQAFDSDNADDRNNPEMAEAFKSIGKPIDVEVNEGKTIMQEGMNDQLAKMGLLALANDHQKLVLSIKDLARLKEGNQWVDSVSEEANKVVHEFRVSKIDGMYAELLVTSTIKMSMDIKEGGVDAKQTMKGTLISKRSYNKETGLLKREESNFEMNGALDVMGISAPMAIKGKMTTTVSE